MRAKLIVPDAGIYEGGGTVEGERWWIAYDDEGELQIATGAGAFQRLETWLNSRGVELPKRALLELLP